MRDFFEIKLNSELNSEFLDEDFDELEFYLFEIGLLKQIPVYSNLIGESNCKVTYKDIMLQPGMLYCHAKAALDTLVLNESAIKEWDIKDKGKFYERIDKQTKGDILEMLGLYDTFCSFPQIKNIYDSSNYYISKLRLENVFYNNVSLDGKEIDVIIRAPGKQIYLLEVKYSEIKTVEQIANLTNATLNNYIEEKFDGKIAGRAVIYNGETDLTGEIKYINASEYLAWVRHASRFEELLSDKITKKPSEGGDDGDQDGTDSLNPSNNEIKSTSNDEQTAASSTSGTLKPNQSTNSDKSDSSTSNTGNTIKAQFTSPEEDIADDFGDR